MLLNVSPPNPMTTPEAILLDLSIGRSTSESIGKRLRVCVDTDYRRP